MGFWDIPNDYQQEASTFNGSAHSISQDAPEDVVEALIANAEEATGTVIDRHEKRIGFY